MCKIKKYLVSNSILAVYPAAVHRKELIRSYGSKTSRKTDMLRSVATQPLAAVYRTLCTAPVPQTIPRRGSMYRPCGVLARKVGMMNLWDDNGSRHPITVLCIDRCHVLQVREPNRNDKNERWGIQIGAGPKRPYKTNKAHRYHCAKAGVEPKQKLLEFLVHKSLTIPVGTELRANHFEAGQYVDVTGTSIGKGTQGVMKRWGFAGGPASHGCSKAHRKGGSIGMSTKPGRVFKGKKMAGRMGNEKKTVQNLMVFRVDTERNLIYVRGAVPGNSGNWVVVRDAVLKMKAGDVMQPALRCSTEGVIEWRKKGLTAAL